MLHLLATLSSCGAIVTHAILPRAQAREVAHRWRPVPLVTDGSVTFRSTIAMQRYVRTLILLEEQRTSFAILQQVPRRGLTLYVVHPDPQAPMVHTVRGFVSTAAGQDTCLEALATWHVELFPHARLCIHRDVYDAWQQTDTS